MTQFYDALKALASHELISEASVFLDERESDTSKAVSSIIPSLLGVILKKGATPQLREIFEEAGRLNILAEVKNLWQNQLTQDQQRIGDNLLQNLLGDKAADFTDPIATQSGISKVSTNKLVSMIAPIVAGFLGNKMVKENYSLHTLLTEIGKEKDRFKDMIPSGIISTFGLSSVLDKKPEEYENGTPVKKSNYGWVKWVIAILALLLLFFLWRSCRDRDNRSDSEVVENRNTMVTDSISQGRPITMDSTRTQMEETELTLPNGMKLRAYKGGIEDQMIKFLESDEYKKAKDNDLKNKWFKFDNINFNFDSATELQSGSEQLNNIAQILKYYKNAKIVIAAYADKVGTEPANMEISKKRAETLKSMLSSKGVGSQIAQTKGYGDEYAKYNADESDDKRASDRDMALRFVK